MYNFDLISDTHIDFYLKPTDNDEKLNTKMDEFIQRLLPENPQKVLVIAGDLGHYERQNKLFIQKLKEFYKHIILVSGNHDYYLETQSIKNKYKRNSLNRIKEMKKFSSEIGNVHYLDGEIIEIDGVKYGGVGMWYDFSYGEKVLGACKENIYLLWWNAMNDWECISSLNIETSLEKFKEEKQKLNQIIDESDIIITHVGPDWSKTTYKYQDDLTTSFYVFDGREFFNRINGKVWAYGHTHENADYDAYGCRFVNAALGYRSENNGSRKIRNISSDSTWE